MGYMRSRPSGIVRAVLVCGLAVVAASSWAAVALSAPPVRLSIVTGGTGGVYFPMGGGLAQLISKYLPDTQATAEVTSASVDNMRLIGAKRADIAFTLADTAYDAFTGHATSAVLDLATTPGLRIRLVPLDTTIAELQKTYGNLYFKAVILKEIYPGAPANAATVGVANLLVVHQDFNGDLAYQITKLIYERRSELAQVHKEAANITLTGVVGRSPVPFHPGAIRYFKEKGVQGF